MYVYICIHIHTYAYTYIHTHMHIHMHIHMYVCMRSMCSLRGRIIFRMRTYATRAHTHTHTHTHSSAFLFNVILITYIINLKILVIAAPKFAREQATFSATPQYRASEPTSSAKDIYKSTQNPHVMSAVTATVIHSYLKCLVGMSRCQTRRNWAFGRYGKMGQMALMCARRHEGSSPCDLAQQKEVYACSRRS